MVECRVVTLALHVQLLNLPLRVDLRHPVRDVLVVQEVAEVVQEGVWHVNGVAGPPVDIFWLHHVVEVPPVGGGAVLDALADHMTVKSSQKTHEGEVVWWDVPLQVRVIDVSKTLII